MSFRPLVAVTTTMWPGGSHGLPRVQLNAQYLTALDAAGATPVMLTPAHSDQALHGILSICHGLLLSGGEDVEPSRYGQPPHPALGEVNPARDAMEIAAVHEALGRRMPVLAICRGIQVLNVAMGGTLYQDIPSELGGDLLHEQAAPWNVRWHAGRVQPGCSLERVFGTAELHINSFHHQAIRDLAPGLRATVRAEDGVIEGVEGIDHPWLCGVQWHPERGEAHGPAGDSRDPDRRLFWAFAQAAREFADSREAETAGATSAMPERAGSTVPS